MKRRDHTPEVESLETKNLLSALGTGMPHAAMVDVARGVRHHPIALNGTITGDWTQQFTNPDVGQTQMIIGSGTVRPLGQVHAEGTMHAPGFITEGRATGTVTLSTARGSVTIELTSDPVAGFSALPSQYTYKIIASTGNQRGATGHGTANLQEVVEAAATSVAGGPSGTYLSGFAPPSLTLTLHSSRGR